MSQQQNNQAPQSQPGTLVSVKRVRRDQDAKGRDKLVLTFGTDKEGRDGLSELIAALETYRGKQVNFDIRVEEKASKSGATFDTAFVIVKEMIPKDQGGGQQSAYVTKTPNKTAQVKASAATIKENFE